MTEFIAVGEPNPGAQFCRRFGVELPAYHNLGEIRAEMDLVEPQLIGVLAEHKSAMDTPKMVNLKNELPLVRIVDIRLDQIARLQALATPFNPGLDGFEDLVEDVHRAMVTTEEVVRYDFRSNSGRECRLVSLLAERCYLVRQAAFFKRNLYESNAPARQARNIENARSIASAYEGLEGFEDYVERVYGVLVPDSVVLQRAFWEQTTQVRDPYRARQLDNMLKTIPEVWNFGFWSGTGDPRVA